MFERRTQFIRSTLILESLYSSYASQYILNLIELPYLAMILAQAESFTNAISVRYAYDDA
jgi:hypothetical protein